MEGLPWHGCQIITLSHTLIVLVRINIVFADWWSQAHTHCTTKINQTMKKKNIREQSLYGIVYPNDMHSIMDELNKISEHITDIYSSINPNRIIRVEFDFNMISKGDVYKLLINATKLANGIRCSERKLCRILAKYTNLASNPACNKRLDAILRSFKRYKKIFK